MLKVRQAATLKDVIDTPLGIVTMYSSTALNLRVFEAVVRWEWWWNIDRKWKLIPVHMYFSTEGQPHQEQWA